MCILFEPAELTDTTLYVGECNHPDHGLIHVVGYQNHVRNLSTGANCMVLHFPCETPMTAKNALDCSATPKILQNMREALQLIGSRATLGMGDNRSAKVHVFDVGSYTVVMSENPSLIPQALELVPEKKRPSLNTEIFDWYEQNFAGYSVALCCFESQVDQENEPLLWWYKPRRTDVLAAPAIDSHDGHTPKLGVNVVVDHCLVVSLPEWCADYESEHDESSKPSTIVKYVIEAAEGIDDIFRQKKAPPGAEVVYKDWIPDSLKPFLPSHVAGCKFLGLMTNGDFQIARLGLTPETLNNNISRVAPTN